MPTLPPGTAVIDLREAARRVSVAWDALRGARFGPGAPIPPSTDLQEQTQGTRQFQYPVGVNMQMTPRREQPDLLTPFDQLRNLAALYDVAAMCIAVRIEEVQGLDWAIVPKDKKKQTELQDECDAIAEFFKSPDKLNDFSAWIGMLLYDLFSVDAPTLYKRPDRAGRLYALEVVDGSTIKPLLDGRGRTVAYQQILYGMPFSQYRRPSADEPDEELPIYTPHELVYRPRWARSFTPYGFPPTEWIIIRVNTAVRKQTFDLRYFTDGNIPDMIAYPPEASLDPTQVEQFEIWFNSVLEGNDAARRKIKFLPWAANLQELRPFTYETTLDEWMLKVTCSAYGVPPQELGFTNDVNRATAELQEAVNERRGLKPLANWTKKSMLDGFVQEDLAKAWGPREDQAVSYPAQPTRPPTNPFKLVEWHWNFGDDDDKLVQAQSDLIYHQVGAISSDEIRVMRFGDMLDGKAPGPPQLQGFGGQPGFGGQSGFGGFGDFLSARGQNPNPQNPTPQLPAPQLPAPHGGAPEASPSPFRRAAGSSAAGAGAAGSVAANGEGWRGYG